MAFALEPLAHRMRPQNLDEFFGQEKLLGPGQPLRKWIESDQVPSFVLWGPPGTGKTTLAQIIAQLTKHKFVTLSAVSAGIKDIKSVVDQSAPEWIRTKTLLFVDEIHRFNKAQQDALLPNVESGAITLIGATTENPSFEVIGALLSRLRVLRIEPHTHSSLLKILNRAVHDLDRGLASRFFFEDGSLEWIAESCSGDARRALSMLESLSLSVDPGPVSLTQVKNCLETGIGKQPILYDRAGEEHYNVISAFIKCMRANDPTAAIYYLARMLEGGEDPIFIARRMVIFASEDIGNADPRALMIAIAAKEAVEFIGMPESRIVLSQAVAYLASTVKSRASYYAIEEAIAEVQKSGAQPVPMHLRNPVTKLMKDHGYGRPASGKDSNLPEAVVHENFYRPENIGQEKLLLTRLRELGRI